MTETDVTVRERETAGAPTEPQRASSRLAAWVEILIPRICGLVFLYAGAMKALDGTRTHAVFAFDHIPGPLIVPLTHIVWMAEVVLGLLLVIGIAKRRAIVATILVLFVYSLQLAYLIAAQNPPPCSCAAGVELAKRFASAKLALGIGLVRNALMAASLEWVRLRMAGRTRAPSSQ
jgi:uncharacterized membrane protein YphA (DoxX/SURF4 family)